MPSLQRISDAARHPLTVTIVGFILTGLAGTAFTTWIHGEESKRALLAASQARGVQAIHEIVDLVNERRTRAVMVSSAIRRTSPLEVEARKAAYDDVYVRWNTKEDGIIIEIQEFLEAVAPDRYQRYVATFKAALTSVHAQSTTEQQAGDTGSKPGLLSQIDGCVTDAYDEYRRTGFTATDTGKARLAECRFDRLDNQLIDCTHIIAGSLYGIISRLGDRRMARSRIQDDPVTIEGACVPPPPPT